ncbi:hypothetical protein SAY87_018312 [Trapa incisa]|uniref:GATA-type domain-containing protein n=1 Tax=Trapa incisa TaxID=236973 RepID=A0AAN7L3U3_9MYRT|nr:hypothetical protein SAY87_018312 [Trapa incisa]
MHRCGSSNHMVGPGSCSCGAFHHGGQSSPLSLLFPADPYSSYPVPYPYSTSYAAASSSPSVDCTLSLGTPSTRMSEADPDDTGRKARGGASHERRSSISNFCWDILQTTNNAPPSAAASKSSGRGGGCGSGDPLIARRCANCDTTSTPLWRNGPRGPKSLCNACGIRFKKEERRATAAAATAGGMADSQPMFSHAQYGSWAAAAQPHPQNKLPCYGTEFRFMEEEAYHHHHHHHHHPDNGISFLSSWHLNIADRPSGLVHDFTR